MNMKNNINFLAVLVTALTIMPTYSMWDQAKKLTDTYVIQPIINNPKKSLAFAGLGITAGIVGYKVYQEYEKNRAITESRDKQNKKLEAQVDFCKAVETRNLLKAQELLAQDLNVNCRMNYTDNDVKFEKGTPLHVAAALGDIDMIKLLIRNKALIDAKAADGSLTALHVACYKGHFYILKFLVEAGADFECASMQNGASPLFIAAEKGYENIVTFLLRKKINDKTVIDDEIRFFTNNQNCTTLTPLHVACQNGHFIIAGFLIVFGADVNAKTNKGLSPLHFAAHGGHEPIVELLIDSGADINAQSSPTSPGIAKTIPILLACEQGHLSVVKLLVQRGANIKNSAYWLLLAAVRKGHFDIVRFLINAGDTIQGTIWSGQTLLHIAAQEGYQNIVQYLVEHGIDIKAKGVMRIERINSTHATAMEIAHVQGYNDVAKYLAFVTEYFDKDIIPDSKLFSGKLFPLAVIKNNPYAIQCLLSDKAYSHNLKHYIKTMQLKRDDGIRELIWLDTQNDPNSSTLKTKPGYTVSLQKNLLCALRKKEIPCDIEFVYQS